MLGLCIIPPPQSIGKLDPTPLRTSRGKLNYRIATTMQPKEKEAPQEMSTCLWNQRAKQELHIYLIIGLRQACNLR